MPRKYILDEDKVYTVTQVTRDIRGMLEGVFGDIWIEGEISNYTLSSAGHAYFSLKDKNSLLSCVLFKGNSLRINFDLEDGMQVLVRGKISVYDKRGQYQLYVNSVEPRGQGALQLAFEKLKKSLYEEGLFDEDIKKPLPYLPVCVGVITSPTGAAVRDILKVARRRFSNVEVLIRPVNVQGDKAKHDIVSALEELNEYNDGVKQGLHQGNRIDVIILGRGGGSLEDLWPFNEEIVARAIYSSEIPIVSAVGHEVDYTISDFVADFRAPTPSAAAELVMPEKKELVARIEECATRLKGSIKNKINDIEEEVKALKNSYVLRSPLNVFVQAEQEVDEIVEKCGASIRHLLDIKKGAFGSAAGRLHALSPLAVLDRGYSITFKAGKAIKTAKSLKKGDVLETRLSNGSVRSKVE